jgi:DNA-binding transcriptional MerR regulator
MENLMPIGQFAASSRLSQKALRLYAESGLLPPAWVDPGSGYRYYRADQLHTATVISLLRRAGIPLAEIGAFLQDPSLARLDEFERRALDELADQRRVLRYLKVILKEGSMYEVLTKRVAEQSYVSKSARVLVGELEPFIFASFAELRRDDAAAPPFVLYHGPVNHEEDGPIEVCVPSRDGDKRLPEGEVAFTDISGPQCDFPDILGAYESVYQWAKEHGREPDGPPREIYLSRSDEELRMQIALPLR